MLLVTIITLVVISYLISGFVTYKEALTYSLREYPILAFTDPPEMRLSLSWVAHERTFARFLGCFGWFGLIGVTVVDHFKHGLSIPTEAELRELATAYWDKKGLL